MPKPSFKTADNGYRPPKGVSVHRWLQKAYWGGGAVPTDGDFDDSIRAFARVNWGRWVVDCPWCKSAQLASWEDPRFFCVECGNAPVDGMYIKVQWPSEEDVHSIEIILGKRIPNHRHWTSAESVHDLVIENMKHDINSLEVG